MISLKSKRSFLLLGCLGFAVPVRAGEASLRQDLLRLEEKLSTAAVSDNKGSPGVQKEIANALFKRADASFRAKEYFDTVRALNQLLNATPNIDNYLDAQFYLGRSYEELRYPARSIKAYLRYLSSFASKSDGNHPRLLETISRLLLLKEDMLTEEGETFDRLLVSLVSLNSIPAAQRDEIKLLAAKGAYQTQKMQLAEEWLNDLIRSGRSAHVQADAHFYLGLVNLKLGRYDKAEELFLKIANDDNASHYLIRQLARLDLARLYAARNLPKLAWDWYQKVEGPGESQRLAIYESVGLLMQSENFAKARELGETYIKAFPNTKEAALIRERMAYLQLSSGSFEAAESTVMNRQKDLDSLGQRLSKKYEGSIIVQSNDLDELRRAAAVMNIESVVLNRAAALNHRLDRAKSLVAEHRQQLRSLQYTLGRAGTASLRPELFAKDEQFWSYVEDLSAIGEKMIANEIAFYNWTEAQQISFVKGQERREKIRLDKTARPVQWQNMYQLGMIEYRSAELNKRILQGKAELAAAIYNGKKGNAKQQDLSHEADDRIKEYNKLNKKLDLAMENERELWLKNSKYSSPLLRTRKRFLMLAQEFLDTNVTLSEQRDRYPDPATKHVQEDYATNWQIWPRVAGKILTLIRDREKQEEDWVTAQQKTQTKAVETAEKLADREDALRFSIARATGKALPDVISYMRLAINEQAARGKKWLADVDWQRYLRETDERNRQQAKHDVDETRLRENQKDSEIERALHE